MEADQLSVTTEKNDIAEAVCGTNRLPWLGVFLNCYGFSGAGYFYCRQYWRASLAMLAAVSLYAILYKLVFVESISFNVLLLTAVLCICGLKMVISVDTFKIIRRQNSAEFEALRKGQKDAWLAVFLTAIWPGLGLLYLRKWIYFGLSLLIIMFAWDKIVEHFMSDLPEKYEGIRQFALNFLLTGAIATVCFRLVVKDRTSICRMNSLYRCGFVLVVTWCILFLSVLVFVKNVLQVYDISSGSMEPTIFTGERVLVDKLAYINKKPLPGDIVVFHSPRVNESWVKRVVATAGQRIEFTEAGVLVVDGQEVSYGASNYEHEQDSLLAQQHRYMPYGKGYTVPDGSYFLVGDNYPDSYDSRHFGPVADEKIIGKVVRVFDLWEY